MSDYSNYLWRPGDRVVATDVLGTELARGVVTLPASDSANYVQVRLDDSYELRRLAVRDLQFECDFDGTTR